MSKEKIFLTKHIQKHDIEENWLKATTFKPAKGQIIVYDKDSNHNYIRFKIGDEESTVNELPFCISRDDIQKLESKLTSNLTVEGNPIVMENLPIGSDISITGGDTSLPVYLSTGKINKVEINNHFSSIEVIHENGNTYMPEDTWDLWNGPTGYDDLSINPTPGALNEVLAYSYEIGQNFADVRLNKVDIWVLNVYCAVRGNGPDTEPTEIDNINIQLSDYRAEIIDGRVNIYGQFITPDPWLENGEIANSVDGYGLKSLSLSFSNNGKFEEVQEIQTPTIIKSINDVMSIAQVSEANYPLSCTYPQVMSINECAKIDYVNTLDTQSKARDTMIEQDYTDKFNTLSNQLNATQQGLLKNKVVGTSSLSVNNASSTPQTLNITIPNMTPSSGVYLGISSKNITSIDTITDAKYGYSMYEIIYHDGSAKRIGGDKGIAEGPEESLLIFSSESWSPYSTVNIHSDAGFHLTYRNMDTGSEDHFENVPIDILWEEVESEDSMYVRLYYSNYEIPSIDGYEVVGGEGFVNYLEIELINNPTDSILDGQVYIPNSNAEFENVISDRKSFNLFVTNNNQIECEYNVDATLSTITEAVLSAIPTWEGGSY